MKGKKTGGRQKGTPNKENPLKGFIHTHSLNYFTPRLRVDAKGKPIVLPNGSPLVDDAGQPVECSDFEMDMMYLGPGDRVSAEIKLLEFHQAKMKAVDVDMNVHGQVITIEDKLRQLCQDEEE